MLHTSGDGIIILIDFSGAHAVHLRAVYFRAELKVLALAARPFQCNNWPVQLVLLAICEELKGCTCM